MQSPKIKVKKIVSMQAGRLQLSIRLGQDVNEAQAVQRVRASLERHGWLHGSDPRELVRIGGAA